MVGQIRLILHKIGVYLITPDRLAGSNATNIRF